MALALFDVGLVPFDSPGAAVLPALALPAMTNVRSGQENLVAGEGIEPPTPGL